MLPRVWTPETDLPNALGASPGTVDVDVVTVVAMVAAIPDADEEAPVGVCMRASFPPPLWSMPRAPGSDLIGVRPGPSIWCALYANVEGSSMLPRSIPKPSAPSGESSPPPEAAPREVWPRPRSVLLLSLPLLPPVPMPMPIPPAPPKPPCMRAMEEEVPGARTDGPATDDEEEEEEGTKEEEDEEEAPATEEDVVDVTLPYPKPRLSLPTLPLPTPPPPPPALLEPLHVPPVPPPPPPPPPKELLLPLISEKVDMSEGPSDASGMLAAALKIGSTCAPTSLRPRGRKKGERRGWGQKGSSESESASESASMCASASVRARHRASATWELPTVAAMGEDAAMAWEVNGLATGAPRATAMSIWAVGDADADTNDDDNDDDDDDAEEEEEDDEVEAAAAVAVASATFDCGAGAIENDDSGTCTMLLPVPMAPMPDVDSAR